MAKELKWVRPLKGVLLFMAFIGMGIVLQVQPSTGVVLEFNELNVSTVTVTILFFLSGTMELITGLSRWRWNAMWISVFIFYTIVSWVASYRITSNPTIAPIACTLLSAFLIMDIVHDIVGDF